MKVLMSAGKGGSGKSTILYHLLKRHILSMREKHILVVDADPHQSLVSLLCPGKNVATLGELRYSHAASLRQGVGLDEATSRREYALALTKSALHPLSQNADLLAMGRNDQPGCQCVVNSLLADALDALAQRYDLAVVDNEAGIEPIGRHGWAVDVALLVAGPRPLDMNVTRQIVRRAIETGREVRYWALLLNRFLGQPLTFFDPQVVTLRALPYSAQLEFEETPDDDWLRELDYAWTALDFLAFKEGKTEHVPAMVSRSPFSD